MKTFLDRMGAGRVNGDWDSPAGEHAVNTTGAGARDGTSLRSEWLNEYIYYPLQKIFRMAAIQLNHQNDDIENSQIIDALMQPGFNNHKKISGQQAQALSNLSDNDSLSVIMGKIKKMFTALSDADAWEGTANKSMYAYDNMGHNPYMQGTRYLQEWVSLLVSNAKWYYQNFFFDIAGNIKNLSHPVGSFYIQFTDSTGAFLSGEYPNILFGGTWQLCFDGEGVYFQTESSSTALSIMARTNGLQLDAIRNITGEFGTFSAFDSSPLIENLTGVFSYIQDITVSGVSGASARPGKKIGFSAANVVPTDRTNHPRNRFIRVWKRAA